MERAGDEKRGAGTKKNTPEKDSGVRVGMGSARFLTCPALLADRFHQHSYLLDRAFAKLHTPTMTYGDEELGAIYSGASIPTGLLRSVKVI